MPDVCAFGFVTKESEVFRGKFREFTAGPPYFLSVALRRLGSSVQVVTRVSKEDIHILEELEELGVEVVALESSRTTSFHTVYGKTLDERIIRVVSVGDPFRVEDLRYCSSGKYLYVGPLTTTDFNLEFMREASRLAPVVLDVQGFTRKVVGDRIEYVDWEWKLEGAKYVRVFKADRKEGKLLTGSDDPVKAGEEIASWGPEEVLVTSSEGAYLILKDGRKFFEPFKVREVVGRVGRGDTCLASYIHARIKGLDYEDALTFAVAATSLKLTYQGPLRNPEGEVIEFIRKEYGKTLRLSKA